MRRAYPKTGRNAPCPCGSGKKHKSCCINGAQELNTIEALKSSPMGRAHLRKLGVD